MATILKRVSVTALVASTAFLAVAFTQAPGLQEYAFSAWFNSANLTVYAWWIQ